jgi:hypothetical protein
MRAKFKVFAGCVSDVGKANAGDIHGVTLTRRS